MTQLRVIEGNRQRKPKRCRAKMRWPNLPAVATSMRLFVFAVIFTTAAIVFEANPVLVGETLAGYMPIICIFAAWVMTCATGRASMILDAGVLLSCGAALLYLPESDYAPVTAMMLQGHVVAATIGIISGAFASGNNATLVTDQMNNDPTPPLTRTGRSL